MLSYNLTEQLRLLLAKSGEVVAMVAASAGSVAGSVVPHYRKSWTVPRTTRTCSREHHVVSWELSTPKSTNTGYQDHGFVD